MSDPTQNRSTLPAVAAMVDETRAIFGDGVKVIYAEENGQVRDRRDRRCEIAGVECIGVEQLERLKAWSAEQPKVLTWD